MKSLLAIVLFIVAFKANAQLTMEPSVYFDYSWDLGNYGGRSFSLNYITEKDLFFQIFYNEYYRLPIWYNNPNASIFSFITIPPEKNFNSGAAFGKVFYLNKIETIRFNLVGGIGFSLLKEPEYSYNSSSDVRYFESSSLAVYFNPRIEFPVSRYIGFGIGSRMTATSNRYYFAFTSSVIFGSLRVKKDKRKLK
ncbi:hypothetical protein [Mangrovivirga cuniculi]|uniref:Outer membrane protein beta-barrel domain-containing protein n=1 Tax=Mangrovivirga cuniculi TaxID=2715131 RepID=A0A4D7JR74_9BACT|nr:hypothetical protein [Mangrovivirga cuniculi]QCK14176.1 hypothetical protein DCC35_05165 [Mangrovivirga cuniculi]